MEFTATTTVSIIDQETGDPKPFDEWDNDADLVHAYGRIDDEFSMGIALDESQYDLISNPRKHFTKADEHHGKYTIRFEVEKAALVHKIGHDEFPFISDTGDVDVEERYIDGDGSGFAYMSVRGCPAEEVEMGSRAFDALEGEYGEVKMVERFGSDWDNPHEQNWYGFEARVPAHDLLDTHTTMNDWVNAVSSGNEAVDIEWAGW